MSKQQQQQNYSQFEMFFFFILCSSWELSISYFDRLIWYFYHKHFIRVEYSMASKESIIKWTRLKYAACFSSSLAVPYLYIKLITANRVCVCASCLMLRFMWYNAKKKIVGICSLQYKKIIIMILLLDEAMYRVAHYLWKWNFHNSFFSSMFVCTTIEVTILQTKKKKNLIIVALTSFKRRILESEGIIDSEIVRRKYKSLMLEMIALL